MMDARVFGTKLTVGRLLTHLALLFFVILWTLPTLGLFVSSLRDKDQLIVSGWWTALATSERNERGRTGDAEDQIEVDGRYVISGSFFEEGGSKSIKTFGTSQRDLSAFNPGELVTLEDGSEFTLQTNGSYEWVSDVPFEIERGMRVFYVAGIPPVFTLQNYREVLSSEGIDQSFVNTLVVTVPATIIPILIAAFAAYAFSWMRFPGRQLLFVVVVALLVVPLQMSLIPLLRMYNTVGSTFGFEAKSYVGIWLAHT
ncbi:MAG: carbohydrate ABC transporter permease, partial [Pseudomonadota bacterium]